MARELGENYEEDLLIDKYNLDEEAKDQPRRYYYYSKMLAEKKKERAQLKRKLSVVKVKVAKDIRENFEKYGYEKKPAIKEVGNEVEHSDEVEVLEQELIQLDYDIGIMDGAVAAFRGRKFQISDMVTLYTANYWSDPNMKGKQMNPEEEREVAAEQRAGLNAGKPKLRLGRIARLRDEQGGD